MNSNSDGFDPAIHSTLHINGELKRWGDRWVVRAFTMSELAAWNWIAKLGGDFKTVYSVLYERVLSGPRDSSESNPCNASIGSPERPYVSSESELGLHVKSIIASYGEKVAAFFLIYSTPYNRAAVQEALGSHLQKLSSEHYYESGLALQLAIKREMDLTEAESSEGSLSFIQRTMTEEFIGDLQDWRANAHLKCEEVLGGFEQQQLNFTEKFESATTFYRSSLNRYRALTKRTIRWAAKEIKLAEADWEAKKSRLKEQLEINSTISYWQTREQAHAWAKYFWLFSLVVIMLGTLCVMRASGESFEKSIHPKLVAALSNDEENKTTNLSPSQAPIPLKKAIDGVGDVRMDITPDVVVAILIKGAGAILILVFSGILLKVALRQYTNNVALSVFAGERIAFIKTYLALMDEGKLDGREDRNLVLQALFRSSSGNVSDIPITTPTEILVRGAEIKS